MFTKAEPKKIAPIVLLYDTASIVLVLFKVFSYYKEPHAIRGIFGTPMKLKCKNPF